MAKSEYKIKLSKLRKPEYEDVAGALYREHKINSEMKDGYLYASIYTNKQRESLHSFLDKYDYDKDLLNELFNKEHLELKENKNSIDMRRDNKLNEGKTEVIDEKIFEELGVAPQSVAKIIGTVYQTEFLDKDKELDIDKLYDAVEKKWDSVIDKYDKANEQEADDAGIAEDEIQYELDAPLSDGSVTLKELGVESAEDFAELLDVLYDIKEIDEIVKEAAEDEEGVVWEDTTKLDGNDAIKSFEKLLDDFNVEDTKKDDVDVADEGATADNDYITESMKNGAEFAKIEDIEREAFERGKQAGILESKEAKVKNKKGDETKVEYEDKAPKGTKKEPVSDKELKACKSKNIAALKLMSRDAAVSGEAREAIRGLKMSSTCEDIDKVITVCEKIEGKIAKDILKCLNTIKVCACSLGKANESVTANFAKYKGLFEGVGDTADDTNTDSDKKDDNGAAPDSQEPEKKDAEGDKEGDKKDGEDDEEGEASKVVLTVKKKEGSDVEDFIEQLKKDLIDAGVEEGDIEVVEDKKDEEGDKKEGEAEGEEKKSDEIKVKIDSNSIKGLLEFGKKHNIDIEDLCGCEFDIEDDDDAEADKDKDGEGDKSGDEGDKKNGEGDDKKDDADAGLTDDMWANIFGEE